MEIKDLIALKGQVFALDTETTGLSWTHDRMIGLSVHCPALAISEYIFTCDYAQVEYPVGKPRKQWTGETQIVDTGATKIKRVWTGDYQGKKKVYEDRLEPVMKTVKVYEVRQPVKVLNTAIPDQARIEEATQVLRDVMRDPKTCVVFHNSKFDCHFLNLDMLTFPCRMLDTSVMVHLYDSRLRKSLDACERLFLGKDSKRAQVAQAPKSLAKKPWHWEPDVIADYGRNDAVVTYQLAEVLVPKLRKLRLMELLVSNMQYSKVLWQVERRGMMIDPDFIAQADKAFSDNLALMEKELYDTVGYEFNWRSNPQLSQALYTDLNIAKPRNITQDNGRMAEKYNEVCTSAFMLEQSKHPLGGLVLDLREAAKLRKTIEKYTVLADQNVIHTNFNQTGTRTGRLSSSRPNVQNVASRRRKRETVSAYSGGAYREDEYNLRMAFVARPGYKFVSLDHAQQEQRLLAILVNDPIMLEALQNRLDIHLMIAVKVWGDCGKELNKLHRDWSKQISFGLIYGLSLHGLMVRLNKSETEAQEIVDQYWGMFPGVLPWVQKTTEGMYRTNLVRYWSSRIWREDESKHFYKGINALVQGGAADMMQVAVIRAQAICNHNGWGSVVNVVHDEMIAEIKDEYVDVATPVLMRVMELEDIHGLPFKAEAKIGTSYGQFEEYPQIDVSTVDWKQYLPEDTDYSKLTLTPWKEK